MDETRLRTIEQLQNFLNATPRCQSYGDLSPLTIYQKSPRQHTEASP